MTCRSKRLAQRGPAKRNRRPQNKQPDTNQTNESIRVVVRVSLLTQLEGDIGAGNCRAPQPTNRCSCRQDAGQVFSARSAAVLGSRNVSTSNTPELHQIPPALKPAAPEDGRTPLNTYGDPAYREWSCRPRALTRHPAPRLCKFTNDSEMHGSDEQGCSHCLALGLPRCAPKR